MITSGVNTFFYRALLLVFSIGFLCACTTTHVATSYAVLSPDESQISGQIVTAEPGDFVLQQSIVPGELITLLDNVDFVIDASLLGARVQRPAGTQLYRVYGPTLIGKSYCELAPKRDFRYCLSDTNSDGKLNRVGELHVDWARGFGFPPGELELTQELQNGIEYENSTTFSELEDTIGIRYLRGFTGSQHFQVATKGGKGRPVAISARIRIEKDPSALPQSIEVLGVRLEVIENDGRTVRLHISSGFFMSEPLLLVRAPY